ncbi:MAG: copper-binding protein [Acetobacteraceae bacterium]
MLASPFRFVAPLILLTACAGPGPQAAPTTTTPQGIDLGGHAANPRLTVADMSHAGQKGHGTAMSPPAGVSGHGTIEAIDPRRNRVTLKHDPMPAIGWPAMTMVFEAPPTVTLTGLKEGDMVDFTLVPIGGGSYGLGSIKRSMR